MMSTIKRIMTSVSFDSSWITKISTQNWTRPSRQTPTDKCTKVFSLIPGPISFTSVEKPGSECYKLFKQHSDESVIAKLP